MDTLTLTQSLWIAFICSLSLIVMELAYMALIPDKQVLQVAQMVRESSEMYRQFALFIQVASTPPAQPPDDEIDPGVIAELANAYSLIQEQAKKLGISEQELMRRMAKIIEERKRKI